MPSYEVSVMNLLDPNILERYFIYDHIYDIRGVSCATENHND